MQLPVRKTVRILLINEKRQLLLMYFEDFDISSADGTRHKRFWCTIGGGIEDSETIEHAARREIYEETGIASENISMGPRVWHSEVEVVFKGVHTLFDETFVVVHTKQTTVALCAPTEDEKRAVKKLRWFSINDINNCPDTIFPQSLAHYLPDVIAERYPAVPIELPLKRESE